MKKLLFTLPLALLTTGPLCAVQTHSVLQADYAAFSAGEPVNVSISNLGEVSLAPSLEQLAVLDDPIIWRAVADPDGNLYLGTGKEGTVYKMTPSGEVETVFEPEEILARALALDSEGNLYVGTSPAGRVYRIPPGERPEIYFDPADEYIWDMVFDQEGNLYVATGASGTIYKLKPDFKPGDEAVKWFETDRAHVTALAFDPEGNLLAGTAPRAYVYRIAPDGTGTVIYNAGTDEISGISAGEDGVVYFSTLHIQGKKSDKDKPGSAQDLPDILEKLYDGSDSNRNGSDKDGPEEPAAATAPSLLFKIGADGFTEPLWSPVNMNISAFRVNADGSFTVGASENGSLFRVTGLSQWELLQCAESGGEITGLVPVPGEDGALYVLSSNPGAVYKLSGRPAENGSLTSEPMDAELIAKWGALRLFGSPTQEIAGLSWETRTGNTPDPDATWTGWAPLRERAITSPPGRYLQYKAAIGQPDAVLRGVRLFYTARNGAPLINRVNLLPIGLTVVTIPPKAGTINLSQLTGGADPGSFDQEPPPMRQIRPLGEAGYFSAGWRAYDPNGDELVYAVAVKAENATEWVTLTDQLQENVYSFNTRGLADGYYRLRVTASDQPSNPPGEARTGFKLSQPFLVDNTNPTVALETQKRNADNTVLVFSASDKISILTDARYVLDGADPINIQPEDGIFDAQDEIFRIQLDSPKPGPHSIVVEVLDESGNRGVAQTAFTVEASAPAQAQ